MQAFLCSCLLLRVDAGPWVECSTWQGTSRSESGGRGDADSCKCVEIAQGRFAWGVVEACASEALQHAVSAETAWIVFHVGTDDEALGQGRCIVERCFGQCVGASRQRYASSLGHEEDREVRSFVPQEMCPEGSSVILPELGALGGADGVLRPEAAELEFLRLFGPLKLQNQTLQSLRMECIETAHRAVAKVCLQDGCDEWSKYSLPRCDVILGLPYDFGDSNFALAPACVLSGQYYCPLGLPLALKVTLKAASRSAAIWAMMLEGLMPAVVSARRTLSVALSSKGNIPSFLREWIEQEEIRLGCSPELQFFSISRSVAKLEEQARIGLPMALCPTCCRTAAGRLRVVFLRDPFARMSSFFHGYFLKHKEHLLPANDPHLFETWIRLILSPNASASPLFEASDLHHVRPALDRSPTDDPEQMIFCIEDVEKSLRRVESALCTRFGHCTPLPSFPAVKRQTKREPKIGVEVASLVREHYRFDYEALTYC